MLHFKIALLPSSITATRLTKYLSIFGIDEQCGSLPNKGCADAMFTLKNALQTLREHHQETFVVFVDLVKVYGTINQELLWEILELYGVPPTLITVLKKLYQNVTIHLDIENCKICMKSMSGVKQGDNLGPILFIFVMQAVASTLNPKWRFDQPSFKEYGILNNDGVPQNQLCATSPLKEGNPFTFWKSFYVDDTAFILLNRRDLTEASKLVSSHFRRFGLTIHTGSRSANEGSKTEFMHFSKPSSKESTEEDLTDININIDDDKFISSCTFFKYLGSIFTPDLDESSVPKSENLNCHPARNLPSHRSESSSLGL
jgi:hypothetical protein